MLTPSVVLLLASGASGVATPLAVTAGPHPVGVHVIEPATVVWYPAQRPGPQSPTKYRDYVELAVRDAAPGPDGKARTVDGYVAFLRSKGVPAAGDRKSTRLNSSHYALSRMPSSA